MLGKDKSVNSVEELLFLAHHKKRILLFSLSAL